MNGLSHLRANKNGRFSFGLLCPRCGEPCESLTIGNVIGGTQTSAIARCPRCSKDFLVLVLLHSGAPKVPARIKRRGTRLVES